MSKIQNPNLVFKTSLFVVLLTISITGFGSDSKRQLGYADSLFEAKKYTESFEVYEAVLEQGDYTSRMLLKMAFIREGLGDVSGALYFLNQYYNQTSDKKVLGKLEEIARDNQLVGYEFNDADFFINIFRQFRIQFIVSIGAVALFLFGLVYSKNRKYGKTPIPTGIALTISLLLLFYIVNYGVAFDKGIIVDPQTYLMTGPSGGADVIGIIEKGHRVDIIGVEGIWVKIRWDGQEVYIRDNKIKTLS